MKIKVVVTKELDIDTPYIADRMFDTLIDEVCGELRDNDIEATHEELLNFSYITLKECLNILSEKLKINS